MAHPIQIILTRQLAGYLSVPLFLVDPKGNLLFYNEPAETILGRRFEETGAMSAEEWSSAFTPVDEAGQPIPPEELPLRIYAQQDSGRPTGGSSSADWTACSGTSRWRQFRSPALTGEFLGAAALFWETLGMMRVTLFGHARIGGHTGSRDGAIRGQHIGRRGAWRGRHGAGSRRRHRHSPARSTDPARSTGRIDILLTHLHMDHIQGLGFFGPLYDPGDRRPHLGTGQQHALARQPACRAISPRRCFRSIFAICRA